MEPQNLQFGGGASQSFLNPVVLIAIVIVGILICSASRRTALVAFLSAAILIPTDQVLLVGALHFPTLRILAMFGLVRILWAKFTTKERIFSGGVNGIDKAVIALCVAALINGTLLWRVWAYTVFQIGGLVDAFGAYFLLRFLIRDDKDVMRALRVLACVATVVAAIMMYEHVTGRNPYYAALGGARSESYSTAIDRGDIFRARGCFAHPILAGTFGGFLVPLFVGWWWKERRDRKYAAWGALAAAVIPFASGSSTSLFALIGGFVALCFWKVRRHMRSVRWGIVGVLVSLHIVMKAPVWHLISRIDLTGGSSSYHRYQLVNQCIIHFRDWALIGTKDYASWGWDMWDLSNQYVGTADTSGLIPLIAFLAILVYGFKYLGKARRYCDGDKKQEFFIWAIGASLFGNLVAFFGIGYFDQIIVAWYALLAIIAATAFSTRQRRASQKSDDKIFSLGFENHQKRMEVSYLMDQEAVEEFGGPSQESLR